MEENKQKIDDATLVDSEKLDSEKLSEEDMDNVAGGTYKENQNLNEAIANSPVLAKYGWNHFNIQFYTFKRILSDAGIEAGTSWGGANNMYRDKETGQFLLQKEVLDYLETGKKGWLK